MLCLMASMSTRGLTATFAVLAAIFPSLGCACFFGFFDTGLLLTLGTATNALTPLAFFARLDLSLRFLLPLDLVGIGQSGSAASHGSESQAAPLAKKCSSCGTVT